MQDHWQDTKSGNHYIRILIWSKIKRVRKKFIADILTVFSEKEGYVFKFTFHFVVQKLDWSGI